MIQFCTCIGRSASDLELKQNPEVSSPCKSCGGKLLVDGRAAISGSSMLSTVGLELTRVIGLDLTWKTVSKGNRRGRRARTSLAAGHKKKSVSPNSKESEELTDMNSEKVDNMPVSESEKLGVTILGRRFSDIVEKVPIKKRKFLFDRSLSPQAHVPSPCLDESGLLDSQSKVPTGSTQNSNEKMCEKSALNLDVEQGPAVSSKNSVEDKNEKLRVDVDFSGISILATAACDSNTEGAAPPAEGSEGSCGIADNQNIESSLTHAESFEGKQQSCTRVSGGKADLNAGVKLPVEEISRSVETNKDYQTENSTPGRVESSSSSRDDRSRWDLNKVMDEWESHYEDPVVENECHEECETHKENLENGNISLESRNSDFLVETTVGKRPSVAEIVSTLEEHQLDTLASLQDRIIPCKVDCAQNDLLDLDSKTLHSQVDSSIGEIVSASAGHAPCISMETHTLVEEKAVVQCPPSFDSEKVEVINQASFLDRGIHIFESEKITSSGGRQDVSTNGNLGNTDARLIKDPQSNGDGCYIDSEGAFFKIVDTLTADPVIDRASCPAADKSVDPTFCQVGSDALISLASSGCRKLLTTIPDVGEGRVNRDSNLHEDGVSLVADQQFQIDNVGKSTCEDSVFDNQIIDLRSPDSWRKDTDTRSPGQTVLEDLYSSDYYSDVSQNDGDNDDGKENVGKLQAPDDDYQYEDGEFRESALHSWGDDAGDEGDAEHVDYGSDNRDMDTFEAPADSTSLRIDSIETEAKTIVEKIGQEIDRLPGVSCSSESNHLAGLGANRTAGVVRNISTGFFGGKDTREQFGLKVKVASELQINEAKVVEDEFDSKRESVQESDHFEKSRMKFSGWDQLPGIRKSSEAVYEDHSGEGKSFRKVIRSMSGRELPSRIEGLKTSDPSFRKDKVYVQGSRSDSHDNSNPRFERDVSPGKSIGRGGSSLRMRGRGRGCDPWLDSAAGHWGPKRHHSPAYYGPGDFRPSEPKNAAAAAAAKAESSGFVVAPDGTILKPGCVGPSAQRSRQSVNSSSQGVRRRGSPTDRDVGLNFAMKVEFGSTREMSLERSINVGRGRSGRYNNIGRRERYNGPAPDESFDNQHLLPQRERSFSPIPRRARHLCRSQSHTKSRSRSRSRSPRMWASPREGRSGGFNSGPGLRQHSRSPPNFRPEARFDRVMSPHRRPGLGERVVGLFPARSHWSPPHASRWIDDRKSTFDHSPPHPSRWIDDRKSAFDHFREKGYKRSLVSERNDAGRIFSRNHNLHMMPSPGRMNPDEYYRPMHADRLPDFAVVDRANRGMRRDGSDDDRKKPSDRCGPVHHVRHHDIEGKHFRYVDDGFRGHNPRSRSGPNFHGRGNPRDYGRGIECRFGDGPRRGREEKGHFGYDRERKQNSGFETFRVRECEDDVTPGRPSC